MPVRRVYEVNDDAPIAREFKVEEVKAAPVKTQEMATDDLLFDVI
jgi:hypothetical protein